MKTLKVGNQTYGYYDISQMDGLEDLPYTIRILLEGAVRQEDGKHFTKAHIEAIAQWQKLQGQVEIPYRPSRIILQDFTGVPAVVDLAAMRDAVAEAGKDPKTINPVIPVDLVIDHSVMVDYAGSEEALSQNVAIEFERNKERYGFLKWAQKSFDNFRVVPPSTGIIHQVNLEYLASVAMTKDVDGQTLVYPDSLVGTDSHTTMINGLGVLGWGVGGIEAEAGMLGQPLYFILPEVVGLEMVGKMPEGSNATDLALTVTQLLRQHKVVGKFVEYFGQGLDSLSLQDRATIANMSPEYGATMGYFPVDDVTIGYLNNTGRDPEQVALVEAYFKANKLFRTSEAKKPTYTKHITLDLSTVGASLAGPKRPQDRIDLKDMKTAFETVALKPVAEGGFETESLDRSFDISLKGSTTRLKDGHVVLAAITSCTNTSNPTVMIGAGMVAKKAVALGLEVPSYVKTSLTPGSKVVTNYLKAAGVLGDLEALGFHVAGYGCATCIGNSGALDPVIEDTIENNDMTVASVLSGNRNFEGRIHSKIKANYLASPMLVVAYALAGTVRIDFDQDPIGLSKEGQPVYLKDIWPSGVALSQALATANNPAMYLEEYGHVFQGSDNWHDIEATESALYPWDKASTYIQAPPFFTGLMDREVGIPAIEGAAVLALLKDSVTTDHISPAGAISPQSPAAVYLRDHGVEAKDFNSYGSRRGNHEVMMRGTLANIRIRNTMAQGLEGGYTKLVDSGEIVPIYDGAMAYAKAGRDALILAGKEYGTGSSRDWAAKGVQLLGVKAVIAESYERIHRSNLVGMGVLPLQFLPGDSWESLGLDGSEALSLVDLSQTIEPGQALSVQVEGGKTFQVTCRLDSGMEIEYYKNGGILHTVLREMIG